MWAVVYERCKFLERELHTTATIPMLARKWAEECGLDDKTIREGIEEYRLVLARRGLNR